MGDDHVLARDLRRDRAQLAGDVFVGEAVEAVAPHALVVIGARQRERVGDEGMAAVEGGVEAGDLRRPGKASIAASMPAMLCGWCSGASGMSARSFASVASSIRIGSASCRPAVDDAMADGAMTAR